MSPDHGVSPVGGFFDAGSAGGRSFATVPTGRRVRSDGRAFAVPRDPLRIALFLLTLVTIGRVHQSFPAVMALRPALLLVVGTAVLAVLNPQLVSTVTLRSWPARVFAGLVVLACVSAPFGISLGASAVALIEVYSKVFVFGFLLLVAIRGVRDLWFLMWAYVMSTGVLVWLSLSVFTLSTESGNAAMRLGDMYMYDANDIGVVLLIGLPLALLAFQVSTAKGRLASAVIVVGIGAALARTGSRSAFLGAIAVGVMLLLAAPGVSVIRRIVFAALVAVPLVLTAPPGYWERMNTLKEPTEDSNWDHLDGRRQVWRRGMGYMLEYPLFGVGIGNFARAEGTISEKARRHVLGTGIRWMAPHNSFVQAGAELGVPGLILFSLLVLGGIWGMLRLRRRVPRSWARGGPEERFLFLACGYLATSMVGFGVAGFFLSHAYMDHLYFLVALMSGTYACVREKLRRVPEVTSDWAGASDRDGPAGAGTRGAVAAASGRRRGRV